MRNNLTVPAHPVTDQTGQTFRGFTKLEQASITIGAGFASVTGMINGDLKLVAERSVELAKAILEEANK